MSAPVVVEICVVNPVICLVADGMGGHAAGEVASKLSVQMLVERAWDVDDRESLEGVILDLNQGLYNEMEKAPHLRGMGSTVAGLIVFPGKALIFNIGDSRLYKIHGDRLRLLSTDDTLDADLISWTERTGQRSHVITQSLGGASSFEPVAPHLLMTSLSNNERFLVCSDGLTDMLDRKAIESCLTRSPIQSVQALFKAAMDAGGEDNISIVLVDYHADDRRSL